MHEEGATSNKCRRVIEDERLDRLPVNELRGQHVPFAIVRRLQYPVSNIVVALLPEMSLVH